MLLPVVCPCLHESMRRNLLCKEIFLQFYKINCAKTISFENLFYVMILAALVNDFLFEIVSQWGSRALLALFFIWYRTVQVLPRKPSSVPCPSFPWCVFVSVVFFLAGNYLGLFECFLLTVDTEIKVKRIPPTFFFAFAFA